MSADRVANGDTIVAADDAAVTTVSADLSPAPGPALRDTLVARILKGGDRFDTENAGLVIAFLASPLVAERLALWFGAAAVQQIGPNRARLVAAIDRDIAWIDRLLTEQINAILHHRRVQALEASWRGLSYLVDKCDRLENVKVRVLSVTWAEICRDLSRAVEFDQSQMFSKIYNEEFGMPGGEPFGVLIGDYELQHRPAPGHPTDDVAALRAMAQVAAAAFVPFIAGCSPALFGLDSFAELGLQIDLEAIMRQIEYDRWRSLQEDEDSRFIGLVLPRILLRRPYRDDGSRNDGFRFEEASTALDLNEHLWGNAGYAFAGILVRAFAAHGWFADIRGAVRDVIGGGLVEDLPHESFETDRSGVAPKPPLELALSERQERDLIDLGFIPLSRCRDTPYAAFHGNQSVQRPKTYDQAVATSNAKLSAMLQYMLCVSRFAHAVKVIGRERVGAFTTARDCQEMLNRWLMQYCLGNAGGSPEQRARYPLQEGRVKVFDMPGKPGTYGCTIHLKPQFQLDQLTSGFTLITQIAGTAR